MIVILHRSAQLLMKLNVRANLGEAVIGAECVNVLPTSLVQLVSALTLGVIAVGGATVPAASTVQDPVNVILPTLVLIASARMTFASTRTILLEGCAMETESVFPALHSLVADVTKHTLDHCATRRWKLFPSVLLTSHALNVLVWLP